MRNNLLILKIIIAFLFLYLFYIAIKSNEHDIRLYVFIDRRLNDIKKISVTSDSKKISVKEDMDGLLFAGDIYIINKKSMILIVNQPEQSGWLFTNISGGLCYKLFGEGSLKGLLPESRKICNIYP